MSKRVDWQELLEENVDENLQKHACELDKTEAGRMVHNWIASEFDYLPLDYEVECENGRIDADQGNLLYEFKTKHPKVFGDRTPYDRDIRQLNKYLESDDVDAELGVLVYLNRGDLADVEEYLVSDESAVVYEY